MMYSVEGEVAAEDLPLPHPEEAAACRWDEFSLRFPSARRRHGDPFPLPRLGQPRQARERVDSAFAGLNSLATAVFQSDYADDKFPLTRVQLWMMDDVKRRVAAYGPRPLEMTEESALRELGNGPNLYVQEAKNVVGLNPDEVYENIESKA